MSSLEYDYDRDNDSGGAIPVTNDGEYKIDLTCEALAKTPVLTSKTLHQ
jgi:hypothetical protein